MPKLPISEVGETDVAAADIKADSGMVLVKRGAHFTQKILARLKKLGIERVSVRSLTPAATPEVQRSEIQAAVERRFEWVADDPRMLQLREAVLKALTGEVPP